MRFEALATDILAMSSVLPGYTSLWLAVFLDYSLGKPAFCRVLFASVGTTCMGDSDSGRPLDRGEEWADRGGTKVTGYKCPRRD